MHCWMGHKQPLICVESGVWRSLVARSVRVGEVPSSNLGTPIEHGGTGGSVPPWIPLCVRRRARLFLEANERLGEAGPVIPVTHAERQSCSPSAPQREAGFFMREEQNGQPPDA